METKQKKQIEKGNQKLPPITEMERNELPPKTELQTQQFSVNPDQERMITGNFIQALRTFMLREYDVAYLERDNVSLFADILQLLDSYAEELDSLSEQNRTIVDAIADNPRLMIFIKELISGTPLRIALAKSDLTDMQPDRDEEDYDAYNYAVALSRERRQKAKNQVNTRMQKCQACSETAQKFYQEMQLESEEVDGFINFLHTTIEAIYDADIDTNMLHSLWRAFSFDKEVKSAKEQGIIEGKNTIIQSRKQSYSDGLPSFSSSGTRQESAPKEGYIENLMKRKFI